MKFKDGLSFFEYFETKGWINPSDMTSLVEVLYRMNSHNFLKRLLEIFMNRFLRPNKLKTVP